MTDEVTIMDVEEEAPARTSSGGPRQPWIEKYRPKEFSDIVGNEEAVSRLALFARAGNAPHLLLAGAPGVGKTSAALCLASALLGPARRQALLELNASNDRGIDVVRNKIKMFAQQKVTLPAGRHKLVLLDEADSMTEGAQQALRRTMELYSGTTRFMLAANNSEKIIEPIQSRCAVLRFARLTDAQILAKVLEVCEREGLEHSSDGAAAVAFTAQGDLRAALNNLQATAAAAARVQPEDVFRVCDEPHPLLARQALAAAAAGDLLEADRGLAVLARRGYAAEDLLAALFKAARTLDAPERTRLRMARELASAQRLAADGLATPLQITALLARCVLAARE